ncbi:SMI1/KNR4 family protein [Streptomyces sp. ISL-43]|uniref:SMI1/KNR4 family protein n=1 Tax=Streptomyces sp. ISL-43 TaxID=2819183 RepID=UPI001BE54009|nr:SMI1/KNR4 family protein [Streptomyces sp. ISL-43]MBT2452919.1 SMI1/KNR4 family protein [Streptomyces sp. ISL-43]
MSDEAGVGAATELLAEVFPMEWREPPLGWDAVHAWERTEGLVLPEPYRTFVAVLADGSSLGPPDDGGLLPLDQLPGDWSFGARDAAAEFPLTEAWFWEEDPRGAEEVQPLVESVYRHGSVVLGAGGGPVYWLLVVSGLQRGRIWLLSEIGALPLPGPEDAERDGTTFLDWVRRWHEDPDGWDLPSE